MVRQAIHAILWDLEGTLVQRSHRLPAISPLGSSTQLAAADLAGLSPEDALRRLLEESQSREPAVRTSPVDATLAQQGVGFVHPTRGVENVLADLPMRTHRFALVTSGERAVAMAILKRFGWEWRFEVTVCAEDVTHLKPHPEPYLLACERLQLAPEQTLAVEDSPAGVASARAAGCTVAALPGTHALDELKGAHYTLSNLGALTGLLSVIK